MDSSGGTNISRVTLVGISEGACTEALRNDVVPW